MDSQTLVNILVEIAELEDLQLKARKTLQDNKRKSTSLKDLQAEYEADAAEAKKGAQDAARSLREIDREMKLTEARITDRRDHLVGISDRRQHRALTEEISALETKLSQLEDEAMACLQAEEDGQKAATEALSESDHQKDSGTQKRQQIKEESSILATRLENIEADLGRLLTMLPPAEKRQLERLRSKLEQSVVYQHNGACCGCFHQLPVQEAINVKRGRALVRCPSCMRYIVHRPWK